MEKISIGRQFITELNVTTSKTLSGYNDVRARPFYALNFRLTGDIDFYLKGKKVNSPAETVLFMPKDTAYSYKSKAPGEIVSVHFNVPKSLEIDRIISFKPDNTALFRSLYLSMADDLSRFTATDREKTARHMRAVSTFYRILSLIEAESENGDENKRLYYLISDSVRYMDTEFHDPQLSIPYLAEISGLSEPYFRRVFNKIYGCTPSEYICGLRVERAKSLLSSGSGTVAAISEKCGFSNPNYFCFVFRRQTGVPPSEFMKI